MPYGVSDAIWIMLPPDDQAQIMAEWQASQGGGGTGGAIPASWPSDQPPPDPYFLDLGLSTPEEQQQALAELFNSGYTYEQFVSEFFGGDVQQYDGSGGGGYIPPIGPPGGGVPQAAKFSEIDLAVPGAPAWWKALSPDVTNPISSYQTLSNLLIPFLSPEDQQTVSANLFQMNPDQFSFYDPELLERGGIPSEITPDIRSRFFTGERANKALEAFDRLLEVSGKTGEDFGPGYSYLRSLADVFTDFGLTSGASQLSETQQGQLLSALDPLLAQSKSDPSLKAFGPIAQSFSLPFFSGGSLTGKVKNQFGDLISPPNPRYY